MSVAVAGVEAVAAAAMPAAMAPPPSAPPAAGFADLLLQGVAGVERQVATADAAMQGFILDETMPPHQVMFALGQAQLSLDLMLQIRNRVVEGYQDIMRMQM